MSPSSLAVFSLRLLRLRMASSTPLKGSVSGSAWAAASRTASTCAALAPSLISTSSCRGSALRPRPDWLRGLPEPLFPLPDREVEPPLLLFSRGLIDSGVCWKTGDVQSTWPKCLIGAGRPLPENSLLLKIPGANGRPLRTKDSDRPLLRSPVQGCDSKVPVDYLRLDNPPTTVKSPVTEWLPASSYAPRSPRRSNSKSSGSGASIDSIDPVRGWAKPIFAA